MQSELPNEIKEYLHEEEQVLWWGKPNRWIISSEEKITFLSIILSAFVFVLMFTFVFGSVQGFVRKLGVGLLYSSLISLLACLGYMLYLFTIKKYTWFAITDQRVMKVSPMDSPYELIEKELEDLAFFESRPYRKGGSLYLGRYRKVFKSLRFDYLARMTEINTDQRDHYGFIVWRRRILPSKAFKTADYLCFFDLTDPEIPAQIIRERTSAKEYIDPKRKKYKAE